MHTLAIGVDLVEIRRMQVMLDRHGERGLNHLLTEDEQVFCLGRPKPAQHVAGRVAAKEASFKALQVADGADSISWLDIEVLPGYDGRPIVQFHGRAKTVADRLGVKDAKISISHSTDTAIAMVVLTG